MCRRTCSVSVDLRFCERESLLCVHELELLSRQIESLLCVHGLAGNEFFLFSLDLFVYHGE